MLRNSRSGDKGCQTKSLNRLYPLRAFRAPLLDGMFFGEILTPPASRLLFAMFLFKSRENTKKPRGFLPVSDASKPEF
jgi:hypothetical protein